MITEELCMHRALQLAALGLGKVQPNPMVGAVVVCDGQIIGEGYHQEYGAPHAEVNAICAVKNQELLKQSTLYVNLEPCSHFGKTPPCAPLIIEKKIPKVVIGMRDPNQKVNGNGIKMLQQAGIEVIENVLTRECVSLNKRFFSYHTRKRPYIFLKWAQTRNGFMDIVRNDDTSKSSNYWITGEALRVWAHKLRHEEQAILVGYNTLINDHPQLTNRFYGHHQPHRFVLCDASQPVAIHNSFTALIGSIKEVLEKLYTLKIQSVIVEGGKKTIQKFLDSHLWDEAFVLIGNINWEHGVEALSLPCIPDNRINIDNEVIYHYLNKEP